MSAFEEHSLAELRDLAEMTVTVAAAYEVGLFEALSESARSPDEVARELALDPRAVAIVLPVLVELKMLERVGGRYRIAERARELADGSPRAAGSGLPLWLDNLRAWTRLADALRRGAPPVEEGPDPAADDEEALAHFMAGMAAAPAERIRRVVDHCIERNPGALSALDLGGGPGHFARGFVDAGLEVTLLDTPETIDFVLDAYALRDVEGLRTVRGDFLEDPLPGGPFDVVLLSNILHIYPPEINQRLLERVAEVTAPDGVAAIGEFVRGRSHRATRFAIVMLLRTEGGNTYSEEEYGEWLQEAGFKGIEVADVDDDRQIVSGIRKS